MGHEHAAQTKTPNKWNWLSSLIDEKRHGVDTFRVVHHDKISFTRYRNALLQCDTRIDYFFASKSLISTPHISIADADILHHDTSSDHHPITLTLQLPFAPAQRPPPPSTLFRRLTSDEESRFLSGIQPLQDWA